MSARSTGCPFCGGRSLFIDRFDVLRCRLCGNGVRGEVRPWGFLPRRFVSHHRAETVRARLNKEAPDAR